MITRTLAILGLGLLGACASDLRFRDQAAVWAVDDARHLTTAPEGNFYAPYAYMADVFVLGGPPRYLRLATGQRALDTNALDEVPDSTWFTNRIGQRAMTPAEIAKGPDAGGPPVPPLVAISGKSGGGNAGFVATDATGRKFLIKMDTPKNPEQQSATDVIVARLLWAVGYHVPSDYVLVLRRGEITVAPDAEVKDALDRERPMTREDLEKILALGPIQQDERYRVLASQFLPGKPLGGAVPSGTRDDDPNDTIPHEHRRVLRALKVFGAWLNHTDLKEDNTLDMLVEEGGSTFVRHYLVDFGEAMGAHAAEKNRREDGWEHFLDWSAAARGYISLGFWIRPWEWLESTPWPSVGVFGIEQFEPREWREAYPYWPVQEAQEDDLFWAAKLVMRFDRPMIEAVVAEAQLSVPEAATYLVDTLEKRRDAIGRAYFSRLTPLDGIELRGSAICGVDLAVRYGFADQVMLERLDEDDDVAARAPVGAGGEVCVERDAKARGYTVVRLQARVGDDEREVLEVHVIEDAQPRIVGVVRD